MTLRPAILAAALACAIPAAVPAAARAQGAQSAAEHVAAGDRERAANPAAALKHYEAVLATEAGNYDALWRAAIAAVDVGEGLADAGQRTAIYKQGEQYARRAVQANPNDAEGHFALSRALGRIAQTLGSRDKVKYAGEVRAQALEALRVNPRHPGALHIMGMWNAEIMRLNGISRFMAKNFLGGQVFGSANWNDAQRYLEQAVAIEPNRLVHRSDLAEVYADRGNTAKAREQAEFVVQAPASEANDAKYKRDAEAVLKRLK
jgi:tetratricopeptide (TPR) repeat protein